MWRVLFVRGVAATVLALCEPPPPQPSLRQSARRGQTIARARAVLHEQLAGAARGPLLAHKSRLAHEIEPHRRMPTAVVGDVDGIVWYEVWRRAELGPLDA